MRRKALAHHSPGLVKRSSLDAVLRKLSGTLHFHACADCRRVYECNCDDAAVNERCQPCRGHDEPVWDAARAPRPCCVGNTELVAEPDRLARYGLAGPGPWFQCKTCARSHPRACVADHLRKDNA